MSFPFPRVAPLLGLLVACGGPLSTDFVADGTYATPSGSPGSDPDTGADPFERDGGSATHGQSNLASDVWTLQEGFERVCNQLDDGIGKAAAKWVQAATRATGGAQPTLHGTLTEHSNGTVAYSSTPADRLVVVPASGSALTLRNIQVEGDINGDILASDFPRCLECSLAAEWADASTSLHFHLDRTSSIWAGSYQSTAGATVVV